LCFILYADKTKLSSFGTAKAYPVVARCANLPTEIRNGNGIGGGRVVGWLPIVCPAAANAFDVVITLF
jgi:Plavaka transposase